MHSSTRILLLVVAMVAIVGGLWILFAINNVVVAILYGALWTAVVLIATRILLAVGLGYNRLRARRDSGTPPRPANAAATLPELTALRDRGLITADEFEAKRAKILERL
jgi:hypothetical protein